MLPPPIQRRLVHSFLHHNHWHRFQDPDDRAGWEASQAADLGYGGSGEIQDYHDGVLQRRYGHITRLRCH